MKVVNDGYEIQEGCDGKVVVVGFSVSARQNSRLAFRTSIGFAVGVFGPVHTCNIGRL